MSAGNKATVEEHGDGILVTLLPLGILKSKGERFMSGCVWCLVVGYVFWINLPAITKPGSNVALSVVIFGLPLAAGLAVIGSAITIGRRRSQIMASPTGLKIVSKGPFGTRQWEWPRDKLHYVTVGPINQGNPSPREKEFDPPRKGLEVIDANKRTQCFFTERDEEEIFWLANIIRAAMRM